MSINNGLIDRRSLFRILKKLQIAEKIKIWTIEVSKANITRMVSAFTTFDMPHKECKFMD